MSGPSDFLDRTRTNRLRMPAVVPEDEVGPDDAEDAQPPPADDDPDDEDDELVLHFQKDVQEPPELVLDGVVEDPVDEVACDELEPEADASASPHGDEADAAPDAAVDGEPTLSASEDEQDDASDPMTDAAS